MQEAAVAATGTWQDPDGVRMPAGLVHAWRQGTNQTLCGVQLSHAGLLRFPHLDWAEVQPETGRDADRGEVRALALHGTRPLSVPSLVDRGTAVTFSQRLVLSSRRHPPARLLATIARSSAINEVLSTEPPRYIWMARAVAFRCPWLMMPSGSGTVGS
jgi:hypothetical protein